MQIFSTPLRVITVLLLITAACMHPTQAQLTMSDPDWKELDAPPPSKVDDSTLKRLIPFEVSVNSEMRWGVDPVSIKITDDGLVRYVVVASSARGVTNAMYEAINCNKAEFKTYARAVSGQAWTAVGNPEWRSLFGNLPSRHAVMLARQGACSGHSAAQSAAEMVNTLKGSPQ
jgi:CNP1-like family